jgi:hypothetical protein
MHTPSPPDYFSFIQPAILRELKIRIISIPGLCSPEPEAARANVTKA